MLIRHRATAKTLSNPAGGHIFVLIQRLRSIECRPHSQRFACRRPGFHVKSEVAPSSKGLTTQ